MTLPIPPHRTGISFTLWCLGGGLVLSLGLAALPVAYWTDLLLIRLWLISVAHSLLPDVYPTTQADHLPAIMYLLLGISKVYQLIDPNLTNARSATLIWLLKLPAIVAHTLTALLLWSTLRKHVPPERAVQAAITYAWNPFAMFIAAIWGQVDSIPLLAMTLAVVLLSNDRFLPAIGAAVVGVLFKPQGLLVGATLLFSQWRRQNPRAWVMAAILVLGAVWLTLFPFVEDGTLMGPFHLFFVLVQRGATLMPLASANAFNLWILWNGSPDTGISGVWSLRTIGLVLFGSLLAWVASLLQRRRDLEGLTLATALVLMGGFLVLTRAHERYSIYSLPFLAILAGLRPSLLWIYLGWSASGLVNCLYVFALHEHRWIFDWLFAPIGSLLPVMLAAVNLLLYAFLLRTSLHASRDPPMDVLSGTSSRLVAGDARQP
jgi:Gpi18-like mannosyltransferase